MRTENKLMMLEAEIPLIQVQDMNLKRDLSYLQICFCSHYGCEVLLGVKSVCTKYLTSTEVKQCPTEDVNNVMYVLIIGNVLEGKNN